MSLSRRACYKCGNVGHYAEVCSSSERLCYNCKSYSTNYHNLASQEVSIATRLTPALGKQPGHESNQCPLPRTTEAKQCYHCQGLGHVQADCPTLRLSGAGAGGGRCYNCNQPGHLAVSKAKNFIYICLENFSLNLSQRACPNPPGAGLGRGGPAGRSGFGGFPRGGFQGAPRSATCYKCGGPNHFARDCQAQAVKCYACGKIGHISKDCPAPTGGPLSTAGKSCYQCGELGHISRDCPNKQTNTEGVPGEADLATIPAVAPPAIAPAA